MDYDNKFYHVMKDSVREMEEALYTYGISLLLLTPMIIGWEVLRHVSPSQPQRVPAVTYVFTSIFTIGFMMTTQWTEPGSSAHGTVLAAVFSLTVAAAEVARGKQVTYGMEARACTTLTVLVSAFVVMRSEGEALSLTIMFYSTALLWSISMTIGSILALRVDPDTTIESEKNCPGEWFGTFRAIPAKMKRRVIAKFEPNTHGVWG